MPSKGAVDEFCDVKQSSQGSKEQTSQACRWVLHIAYSHLSSPRCYWVPWQKTDFLAKNRIFRTKKRLHLDSNHVLATTGKSCANKKVPYFQINFSILANFGFLGGARAVSRKTPSYFMNLICSRRRATGQTDAYVLD